MSTAPITAHGEVIDTDTTSKPPESAPEAEPSVQRRKILWLMIALAVASAVFAGWAGLRWWQAEHDDSIALAHTRDQVMMAAHSDIETMTTLDQSTGKTVDTGVQAWLDVSTDELHDELGKLSEQTKKDLVTAGNVATGRVVEAAVIDLSAGGDSASVIAAVEITVKPPEGETSVVRTRVTADLLRVDGQWKLASLSKVPVVSP